MNIMEYKIPEPAFEKLFRIETLLGDPWPLGDIGTGYSEIVAVRGGSFTGKVNGKVKAFGGDWGLLYDNEVNVIDTKYLLQTDDNEYITVACRGRLIMDMTTMEKCGSFDPEDYYFRTSIEFTTGAEKYKWLNNIVAFAMTIITEEGNVCLDVYQLK
ncbi:MAG: DUF3237 domain-containing protein [Clostridia bacterium]|nr:DUF3237 domain-containing protein [Clostridia bacterium]